MTDWRSNITTISFDADDTLWDFQKVMRASLGFALAELRKIVSDTPHTLTIERMIGLREQVAAELKTTVTNLEAIRLAAFERTLLSINIKDDDLAAHLNSVYLQHRIDDIQLFSDVLPALDALQCRFNLGVISNGNTPLERFGLAGRFRFVIFSQDYGVEKPDPGLFEIAMTQAGCANHQLVHVGDSLENDVGGANKAGVWSVWLNRNGNRNDTDARPDFEIASLTELGNIFGNMI